MWREKRKKETESGTFCIVKSTFNILLIVVYRFGWYLLCIVR